MATQVAEIQSGWSLVRRKDVEVSHIYVDGFLVLKGDLVPWIHLNYHHLLSVRSLELQYFDGEEIGDSIGKLAMLSHLSICCSTSLKCVTNVLRLHYLRVLEINFCPSLEELPSNLGELKSLTHLKLNSCDAIKCLPNSVADLSKLSTLKVKGCESLEALPPNLNVVHLCLWECCRVQYLPSGLTNLQHLDLQLCSLSKQDFPDFIHTQTLVELTVLVCSAHPVERHILNKFLAFPGFSNLQRISLFYLRAEDLPINLDKLPQLLLLDIHLCPNIQYLPCNLKNMHNLQFLFLPSYFILETLPFGLNDSVIVTIAGAHIRKTWKELKQHMGQLFAGASSLTVGMLTEPTQNSSPLFASADLSSPEDSSSWILKNYHLRFLVRFLHLTLSSRVEDISNVIAELPNLTHLYISQGPDLRCLPDTTTRLTHLFLHDFDLDYLSDSLGKLSNLKYLDLDLFDRVFPTALDRLIGLECLTLRFGDSLPDSVAKLSNLNTLELFRCKVSLPENLNIAKLKVVHSSVKSLSTSLCHLEVVHNMNYCFRCCGDNLNMCLKQLVNLKTLSLTCYRLKFFPSIAGLQILQTVLLRDCFNLRELMPNMDELLELSTLNISGTRIKSLPRCITKLPKLQHLILPKCFDKKNLPHQFLGEESTVEIEFDSTDEIYYKHMNYYDPWYKCSTESTDEGIIDLQISPCQWTDPPGVSHGFGDIRTIGGKIPTGETENHNQVMGNLSSRVPSTENPEDMITELCSNFLGTNDLSEDIWMRSLTYERNNHHAIVDVQINSNPHGADKKSNRHKKEITREQILLLRDHMTLIEAAMELGVSRSTMKRRCKELELGKWPSSRKKKSDCTKKRKINSKSPFGGEFSQPNMLCTTNPSGPDNAKRCLDVIQHDASYQVPPVCDSIDHLTPNITEKVRELNMATHRHIDVHESVLECMVGTDVHTLLGVVQDNSSSSSFDIKATYKEDIVRFEWSSTACLNELKEAVAENLKIEVDSFKLKYLDEEEDWVLINTNEHLKRALSFIKNNILRLKVIDL